MSKRKEIGKDYLNTERDNYNQRVDKKQYMGKSKSVEWRKKRRHRSI